MIDPNTMPALPNLASGGMVTRPLPPNQPQPDSPVVPMGGAPVPSMPPLPNRPPEMKTASGGLVMQPPPMSMPRLPERPQTPPNPQADKLRQRVGAKQFFLQQLGVDWTPTDEDLERESQQMPDGDDIVRYSVPESVAVKPKEEPKEELTLDFEPFSPDTEDDWMEVAAVEEPVMGGSGNTTHMNKGQQAANPLNPNQPVSKPGDKKPQEALPPIEVTTASV